MSNTTTRPENNQLTEQLREWIREKSTAIYELKQSELKTKVGHVSPKSDRWVEYKALKLKASILLVALISARLLELDVDDVNKYPYINAIQIREAMAKRSIPHFHRRKKKRMSKKAGQYISLAASCAKKAAA